MLLTTSTLSYPPDMSNNFLSLANMDMNEMPGFES
jgi:hypothetical protein